MTGSAPNCPSDELLLGYVEGRLSEEEAKTVEEHYFQCDTCFSEVERSLEIRAAFSAAGDRGEAAPEPIRKGGRMTWGMWAAAALLVASVGVGVWQSSRGEQAPVQRGASHALALRVEMAGGEVVATWSSIPGADTYVLELFRPDGQLLWEAETRDTRVSVEPSELSATERTVFLRLQALDSLRQVIAGSELVELSLPTEVRR